MAQARQRRSLHKTKVQFELLSLEEKFGALSATIFYLRSAREQYRCFWFIQGSSLFLPPFTAPGRLALTPAGGAELQLQARVRRPRHRRRAAGGRAVHAGHQAEARRSGFASRVLLVLFRLRAVARRPGSAVSVELGGLVIALPPLGLRAPRCEGRFTAERGKRRMKKRFQMKVSVQNFVDI